MNEIGSGSARHPKCSINAGFNLWHKVSDGSFFDAILFIVFNPEVPCEGNKSIASIVLSKTIITPVIN